MMYNLEFSPTYHTKNAQKESITSHHKSLINRTEKILTIVTQEPKKKHALFLKKKQVNDK